MATARAPELETRRGERAAARTPVEPWPGAAPFRFDAAPAARALPPVWLLPFDVDAHTHDAFARADVDCPPEIARSVAKRQGEFLAGRLAAREALRRLGAAQWRDTPGIGPARQPLWPDGLRGSISHAGGLAAAVAARADEWATLGLDIEEIATGEALRAIAALSVDADERALLTRATGLRGLDEGITLAFSAKESLFKSAFAAVGRHFDFDAARLDAIDGPSGRLTLRIATALGGGYDVGRRCQVQFARPRAGMVLTLVAERAGRPAIDRDDGAGARPR